MSETTKLVQSHMVIPFLNNGTKESPEWIQIKKTTDFSQSLNAETEDRKYINDKIATTEVLRYKPSESINLTMYKGEEDFELFFDLYKKLPTGDDAKKQILIVFLGADEDYDEEKQYDAQLSNCTLVMDTMDSVNSTLSVNINHNGTPEWGKVTFTDGVPSFVKA